MIKRLKNNWKFIVIGDRKSKNFKLKHGEFHKINDQKKLKFKFAKICPEDCYIRKYWLQQFKISDANS